MMDDSTMAMHLAAGRAYGEEATCGRKVNYKTEASADRGAAAMTAKRTDGKVLEAYPCWWCKGWHIGRAMGEDERSEFA
jgi:hypothetical protein